MNRPTDDEIKSAIRGGSPVEWNDEPSPRPPKGRYYKPKLARFHGQMPGTVQFQSMGPYNPANAKRGLAGAKRYADSGRTLTAALNALYGAKDVVIREGTPDAPFGLKRWEVDSIRYEALVGRLRRHGETLSLQCGKGAAK